MKLHDNHWLCYLRLKSIVKRLKKKKGLLIIYDQIFEDQERQGITEEVPGKEEVSLVYCSPRHPVVAPSKKTINDWYSI